PVGQMDVVHVYERHCGTDAGAALARAAVPGRRDGRTAHTQPRSALESAHSFEPGGRNCRRQRGRDLPLHRWPRIGRGCPGSPKWVASRRAAEKSGALRADDGRATNSFFGFPPPVARRLRRIEAEGATSHIPEARGRSYSPLARMAYAAGAVFVGGLFAI